MPLISQIFRGEYEPLVAWNRRAPDGNRLKLLRKIREILNLLSGNELIPMLNDLITKNERKELAGKYSIALENMSQAVNQIKPKNKHFFIRPLKLANFSLNEINSLGYKCGEKLWSSCKSRRDRLHGGRQPISSDTVSKLNEFMEEISTTSSFKSVNVRNRILRPKISRFEERAKNLILQKKNDTIKSRENVRHRSLTIFESKSLFTKKFGDPRNMSYPTFRKYLLNAKRFKKPYNVRLKRV